MSSQLSNNNYTTTPTFSNPYIFRYLNNMDQVQIMKREKKDWLKLYHKTLKGLETMINVQKIVKDIKRMAEEVNTIIMEVKGSILMASINNRMTNMMNIAQILKDL